MKRLGKGALVLGSAFIALSVSSVGFVAVIVWNQFRPSTKGTVYETRLFEGRSVAIRATAYNEDCHGALALPGGIHTFEGRPRQSVD